MVRWIRTTAGASMPVDADPVRFWKTGKESRVVLQSGHTVACSLHGEKGKYDGIGFVPHWATCTGADKARQRTAARRKA